jgi:hypothetical protein
MKLFKTFLFEQVAFEQVVDELKVHGYVNIKKMSSKKLAVLTNDNRIDVLIDISSKLPGARYDQTPRSESSAGRVEYQGIIILAKPASKQGKASAGVTNEYTMVATINSFTASGPINILLEGKNKNFEIMGCVEARPVGGDTAGRKKADIVLIDTTGKHYPISIKKDNAEIWESADSYFSEEATRIINQALAKNEIAMSEDRGIFKISPNIAVEATKREKEDVVFGSDLARDGCIVTRSFSSRDFNLDGETLKIQVSHIATTLRDIERTEKDVFFLIRNDKTRRSIKQYPGIRVLAVYKSRVGRTVKVLKR